MASGKRKPPSKAGRRHARTASQDDQFKKHCANKENHIPPSPPPLNRITRSQAAGIGRKTLESITPPRLPRPFTTTSSNFEYVSQRITSLEAQNIRLNREITDRAQQLRSAQSTASVLKRHISKLRSERDTWRDKCQTLQQQNLDLYQELRATRRRLQRSKESARKLQHKLDNFYI